jgi:NADPH:quinone reductase-like Zn-dependent oxidoreductase
MKVARVTSWGSAPEISSTPDLPPPASNQLQVKVVAVAVPPLVRGRAMGKHPSARGASLPFDPSVDGVVQDEATGDLYYVSPMAASLLAERVNIDRHQLVRLEPGADPVAVATLVNPVGSSWMALRCRAIPAGCHGAIVLVLGATSTSGRAAISVARSLGASRIIGMSRNEATLADVDGLDERVVLQEPLSLSSSLGPVHIILDFVGGQAAAALLAAVEVEPGKELQYIHIGDLAGEDSISVPARLLNSKPIRITGSGMGAWDKMDVKKEIGPLLATVAKMPRPLNVVTCPLADIQSVWDTEEAKVKRLVLVN